MDLYRFGPIEVPAYPHSTIQQFECVVNAMVTADGNISNAIASRRVCICSPT